MVLSRESAVSITRHLYFFLLLLSLSLLLWKCWACWDSCRERFNYNYFPFLATPCERRRRSFDSATSNVSAALLPTHTIHFTGGNAIKLAELVRRSNRYCRFISFIFIFSLSLSFSILASPSRSALTRNGTREKLRPCRGVLRFLTLLFYFFNESL